MTPANDFHPRLWRQMLLGGSELLAMRVVIMGSSMLTTVMLVRYLGARLFGTYSAAANIYGVFLGLTLFGFGSVMTREVARTPGQAGRYFVNMAYAGAFLSAIATLGCLFFCRVVGYEPAVRNSALLLSAALWPQFMISTSEALLIGLGRIRAFVLTSMFCSLVEIGIVVGSIHWRFPLPTILLLMVGNRCLFAGLSLRIIVRHVRLDKLRLELPFLIMVLKTSVVFSLVGILTSILLRMDILFLTRLQGVEATGLYAAAYRLVNPWTAVIASFTGVFYPLVARHRQEVALETFQRTCERYCRIVLLFAGLAIVLTVGLSRELVAWLFRSDFEASSRALNLLCFLLIPLCATPTFGLILSVGNYQRYDLLAIAMATVAAMALNYVLASLFSLFGSACATLLSFTLILCVQIYFVRAKMFVLNVHDVVFKPLLVMAAGLAMLWLLRAQAGYVKAPVAVLVALLTAAGLGLVRGRELRILFRKSSLAEG